jgi:hypothetical protein
MNGSRYDCSQVSIDYSDEEFEAVLVEFAKVFNADSCWTELCEGGDEVYMQILFDYAANEGKGMIIEEWMEGCASVDTKFLTSDHHSSHSSQPLDNDKLRCMTDYLMQTQTSGGPDEIPQWECALPKLDLSICSNDLDPTNHPSDIMKEAFVYCIGGGEMTHPPSPSPHPSDMSMSFGYYNPGDLNDWSDLYGQFSFDYGFSMSYWHDDGYSNGGGGNEELLLSYTQEICLLLDEIHQSECLQAVCENPIEGILSLGQDESEMPWLVPTYSPTEAFTPPPTTPPTKQPTHLPTMKPTMQPTKTPTKQPTKKPTKQPTASPTVLETGGVVEVSLEITMTLSGIEPSDIDISSLDAVVELLTASLMEMLPEGAKVRLLSVGGFQISNRMLRYLQEENGNNIGVDVEFEVLLSTVCDTEDTCNESKESLVNEATAVSTELSQKVEDGSIEETIKEKATQQDVALLKAISISPTSLQVSEIKATIIIKKDSKEEIPDSSSSMVTISNLLVAAAVVVFSSSH